MSAMCCYRSESVATVGAANRSLMFCTIAINSSISSADNSAML